MTDLLSNTFTNYKPSSISVSKYSYSIAIVCMYSDIPLLNRFLQSCKPLSVAIYNGSNPPPGGIVQVYSLALSSITADFFLFCHHDIYGDIPSFLKNCLSLPPGPNIYGCVGKTSRGATFWTNTTQPVEVSTLDECLFGFFSNYGFSFDPKLLWTNYSQDLSCLSRSKGGKTFVIPNSIKHSPGIHHAFFVKSGHFRSELSYVHKKWGSFQRT